MASSNVPDTLNERDKELLKSSDYVYDAVHGVVPKDVETAIRLRKDALKAEAKASAKEAPKA